jgi:hypothetical protein
MTQEFSIKRLKQARRAVLKEKIKITALIDGGCPLRGVNRILNFFPSKSVNRHYYFYF